MREGAVGLTLGFLGMTIFRAAEAAGRLTDILRGANLAEVISPLSEERTSPLGNLNLLLATVIFLEIGGMGHIAGALARSYDAVPLSASATPAQVGSVVAIAIEAAGKLFEAGLGLAAPVVVALLLVDAVLGVVGRMAPQIPLYFVGMPLKGLAGVGVFLLSLSAVVGVLTTGFGGWWASLIERGIDAWH
jgi:flagellar biosynthetic protein FliR